MTTTTSAPRREKVCVVAGGHVGIGRIWNSQAALGRLRGSVLDSGVDCAGGRPVLSAHERPEGRALALLETCRRGHHSHQRIDVIVARTVVRVLAATKWLSECRQPASSLLETIGTLKTSCLSILCVEPEGEGAGGALTSRAISSKVCSWRDASLLCCRKQKRRRLIAELGRQRSVDCDPSLERLPASHR